MRSWLLMLLVVFVASPADAQVDDTKTPDSFGFERVLITLVDTPEPLRGHIVGIDGTGVEISLDGNTRRVIWDRIVQIDVPGDRLRNGAVIGAVVLGVLCVVSCHEGIEHGGGYAAAIGINTLFGAAIGAGLDALVPGERTIYRRGTAPAAAPRAAMSLTIRF